jgi:diacylglycerol O-acyltransferase
MTQLAGQDASFLYIENDSIKSHFSMLTIYDQSLLKAPLRYRDILAYFDERVAGMPVFRRKLYPVPMDLDAPYFADDAHFNIKSHVRHVALPKPGDWRQFCSHSDFVGYQFSVLKNLRLQTEV